MKKITLLIVYQKLKSL